MFSRVQDRLTASAFLLLALLLSALKATETLGSELMPGLVLFALIAAASLCASMLFGRLLAPPITRHILEITRAARQVASGDLTQRVDVSGRDEISELAGTFNFMAGRLHTQVSAAGLEEARLSAVLRYMADGLIMADHEGLVRLINPAAEHLLQIDGGSAVGRSLVSVVRDHELANLVSRTMNDDDSTVIPTTIDLGARTGGRSVQAMASLVPQSDRGGRQVLLILHDVTELRRVEIVRREFVANVSHDLRTPVASLKALVETLEDGAIDDPDVAREFVGRMQIEVDGLAQLVEELLELSRIEAGHVSLKLQPTDLGHVVTAAAERMLPLASRQGVRLSVDSPLEPIFALADAERITQVVINLVHNAVKFTEPGGSIVVSTQRREDGIAVLVSDTGVGIARESLTRIFERFYKADKARVAGQGTGLGLAIAKHLVQGHNGRIWAESDGEGRGSTFIFVLPAVAPVREEHEAARREETSVRAVR